MSDTLASEMFFEVFDADPGSSGPCDWGVQRGCLDNFGAPDSRSRNNIANWARRIAWGCGEYSETDRVWCRVWTDTDNGLCLDDQFSFVLGDESTGGDRR